MGLKNTHNSHCQENNNKNNKIHPNYSRERENHGGIVFGHGIEKKKKKETAFIGFKKTQFYCQKKKKKKKKEKKNSAEPRN
jgi:hypothetical protein